MTQAQILHRLDFLESELFALKARMDTAGSGNDWRRMAGVFANDPLFEQAMRYASKYRRSQRSKISRTKARRA